MTTPQDRAQRTIDAVFRAHGVDAAYEPPSGGTPVPCRIIRRAPDLTLGGAEGSPFMQSDMVEVRKTEVSAPARGGTFTLVDGDDEIEILSDPRTEDDFALVWRMTVS